MDNRQSTNTIVMVRPANFGFNPETAENNSFQVNDGANPLQISKAAITEFDAAVELIKSNGINVIVWQDSSEPVKTDAVFPNNWFSTHADGTLLLYPMCSANRRLERDEQLVQMILSEYTVNRDYTMTHYEDEDQYLEGTGSLIIDRVNKIVYACRSVRTDVSLFDKWCAIMEQRGVFFDAVDLQGKPIYHTNVMMTVASDFAVVCLDSIQSEAGKAKVVASLVQTGKEVIEISYEQMNNFCGNMLEVIDRVGQKYLVMSQTSYDALLPDQLQSITAYATPLPININTIERYGGGSARCMIAEIFLTKKKA